MNDVKIVALVPTRGDRPKQLAHMRWMMDAQTKPLHGMVIVDDPPMDPNKKDITFRYRTGLERVFNQYPDCDLVALIEDDDWYSHFYLESMSHEWLRLGKPPTFGIGDTYYYHLGVKAFHHQTHPERSSAFTTFMTRDILCMNWPADEYSFVDIDIWKQFPGKTIAFRKPMAIGIKGYGEGQFFGGIGHTANWAAYKKNPDPKMTWLQNSIEQYSFDFYKQISDNL